MTRLIPDGRNLKSNSQPVDSNGESELFGFVVLVVLR